MRQNELKFNCNKFILMKNRRLFARYSKIVFGFPWLLAAERKQPRTLAAGKSD